MLLAHFMKSAARLFAKRKPAFDGEWASMQYISEQPNTVRMLAFNAAGEMVYRSVLMRTISEEAATMLMSSSNRGNARTNMASESFAAMVFSPRPA